MSAPWNDGLPRTVSTKWFSSSTVVIFGVATHSVSDAPGTRSALTTRAPAGASSVAQLDVNYSYPRFLLYRDAAAAESGLLAEGAVKGLLYEDDEYLGHASRRDFFYVTLDEETRSALR